MHRRRLAVAIALVTTAALAGCASNSAEPTADHTAAGLHFEVAKQVDLDGSPTFDRIHKNGTITIGVKEDQPTLGYLDAATGERSGFDIDVARWTAASLGVDEKHIAFKSIPSSNREAALVNGDVDMYVGTYTITDARKQQVGFAGPYLMTGQGLLVLRSNSSITGSASLSGKTVCSATGSTSIQTIKRDFPDTKTVEFDTYSQCVDALEDHRVDAVTTDQAILLGYAAQDPSTLKVVGEPFSVEGYGIGLAKDDTALRHYLNHKFSDGGATWTSIYSSTLGKSGTKVTQPKPDDY